MKYEAVIKNIPALELVSESVIEEKSFAVIKDEGLVKITEYMKYMTLDVAWRQILGFGVKEFHKKMSSWLQIVTSSNIVVYTMIPMPLLRMTSVYKAKVYLE
jgi:hypothetical protein